jgi:putative lipoprotein
MFGARRPQVNRAKTALFAALGAISALACVAAEAAPRALRGTLAYRERIALPPNARAEVELIDAARADAPATIVAQAVVAPAGQPPIRYELNFDDSSLSPRGRYAVQARIKVDDRLLFVTTQRNPLPPPGADANLMLQAVRAPRPAAAQWTGRWLAEDIGGGGVLDRAQSVIEIAADGRVAGSGGCNRIFGRATFDGASVAFGAMGATRMACAPALMMQEAKFLAALRDARAWRADPARRKLVLLDAAGAALIVFAHM